MPPKKRMETRRILFVSNVDITKNYGGNLVVLDTLRKSGWAVQVVGPFNMDSRSVLSSRGFQVTDTGIRNPTRKGTPPSRYTRGLRQVKTLCRLFSTLKKTDVVLCAEIQFSGFVALSRFILRADTPIIQSCGEFYARSDGVSWAREAQYRWSAKSWDGLIDVEPNRLELRKRQLKIKCPIIVVPNTMPKIRKPVPSTAIGVEPTLAYVGSVNPNVDFVSLAASLRMVNHPFKIVCVLFGPDSQVDEAKSQLVSALAKQVSFVDPMPKAQLIEFLATNCDAGIVHYPPRSVKSFSQTYCAPGKMFDFLSIGLPIVTTANPQLQKLVEQHGFGAAAKEDSVAGFGLAVERLISQINSRQIDNDAIAASFGEHFSSEALETPIQVWFDEVVNFRPE